jgi:RNA polymerase sigma factor (sigma-70 family)
MQEQKSDSEIIEEFRKTGDLACLGVLYKRYTTLVFSVALKYLEDKHKAEDMAMQVFEKLIRELRHHQVENFKAWLYRLVKNECLMKLRKKSVENNVVALNESSSAFVEKLHEMHPVQEKQELEEKLQHLETAISELNEPQRVCVELFYLKEKSYAEIVQITGWDLKQVKSYIQNGKRNLQIKMIQS